MLKVIAMPKPKNKKTPFIDKKTALSFNLVHRSQQVTRTFLFQFEMFKH